MSIRKNLFHCIRWTFLSALCGMFAGTTTTLFLIFLDWATGYRLAHPHIIWILPLAGLLTGGLYHHYGKDIISGNNLILDEIHNPQKTIPFLMIPFIFTSTIVTHLFGGSAGREGSAVQMAAAFSDQLTRVFKITPEERKYLLTAGLGAGFGTAIGAPWAGAVFGMEVLHVERLRPFAWFQCLIASFVGFSVSVLLKAPHSSYPAIDVPPMDLKTFLSVVAAGAIFGIAAKLFSMSAHGVERAFKHWVRYPPLRTLIGGLVVIAFFSMEGSHKYAGLGIPSIQEALTNPAEFKEPVLKTISTSLTIGTGFKGGEFTPLVFIGTTLGSALSSILPVSFGLLAALGFAAVFSGAANTPIACTLMAMEIFGIHIGPFALIACFISYYFSGTHGVYRSQRVHVKKHQKLLRWLSRI